MHPILADWRRLLLQLAASCVLGAVLGGLVGVVIGVGWLDAIVFALPLALLATPLSFSAWYLCRAMPLSRTPPIRLVTAALGSGIISGAIWAAIGYEWWDVLLRDGWERANAPMPVLAALLAGLGGLGYILSVTVHYVLQASEDSAEAGRRVLASEIAHREAELRALRAQVDPHFLFNSLNSIAGLTTADPVRAREMCQRLADFLRESLAVGASPRIPLRREVALAEQYLCVEQVRFGRRLSICATVAAASGDVAVPPLILQPLVENAVRHGVATCLDGGTIRDRDTAGRRPGCHRRGESARRRWRPARHRPGSGSGAPAARGVVWRRGDAARRAIAGRVSRVGDDPDRGRTRMSPGSRLRIVIVDDEEPARIALRQDLESLTGVEVVAECANGFEAVKAVTDVGPDLLILDVQMPKLDGFDVLELIGREVPAIFVTAYDQFALKAFEVHAVDYLLKPFTRERLAAAVGRARDRRGGGAVSASALRASARPPGTPLDRVVIRDGADVHVLAVDKIDYVEAQDDYIAFRAMGKSLLKEQTLSDIEAQLDPRRFVRIHRSYLLNIERVVRVELYAKDSRVAILTDGTKLPVSRAGYQRLQDLL